MNNSSFIQSFFKGTKHSANYGNLSYSGGILYSYGSWFPLAIRLDSGGYLLNADYYGPTTTRHQLKTEFYVKKYEYSKVLVPMSALQEITSIENTQNNLVIIESLPSKETLRVYKRMNKEGVYEEHEAVNHLMGDSVIELLGKYYLSGVDETGKNPHKAYFLTELPHFVTSVKEAREILKPPYVIRAEKEGKEVFRQGEWFFVDEGLPRNYVPKEEVRKDVVLKSPIGATENHQVAFVYQVGGNTFASGYVSHREHLRLFLKGWYSVHHSTQIRSFSANGNVD